MVSAGDSQGAVRLWLRGGRARRAAALLLHNPVLLRDNEIVDAVHSQLIQVRVRRSCGCVVRFYMIPQTESVMERGNTRDLNCRL